MAIVVGASVADAPWTLRHDGAGWSLAPLGIRLRPVHVDPDELDELDDLVSLASERHRSSTTNPRISTLRAPADRSRQPSEFNALLLRPNETVTTVYDVEAPAPVRF